MTDSRFAPDPRTRVGTVHHVSFRVDDLDAALAFYEGLLACERLARPPIPGPPGAWLQAGATQVHLTEYVADDATGFPPGALIPYANHVAFHTDDLAAAEAAFRERGIEILGATSDVAQFFVRDPSGNMIEFSPY